MHQKESMWAYTECCCGNALRAGSLNKDRETGRCISDELVGMCAKWHLWTFLMGDFRTQLNPLIKCGFRKLCFPSSQNEDSVSSSACRCKYPYISERIPWREARTGSISFLFPCGLSARVSIFQAMPFQSIPG